MAYNGSLSIIHFAYIFLWIPVHDKLQIFDSQGAKARVTDNPSPVKIDHLKPELIP